MYFLLEQGKHGDSLAITLKYEKSKVDDFSLCWPHSSLSRWFSFDAIPLVYACCVTLSVVFQTRTHHQVQCQERYYPCFHLRLLWFQVLEIAYQLILSCMDNNESSFILHVYISLSQYNFSKKLSFYSFCILTISLLKITCLKM